MEVAVPTRVCVREPRKLGRQPVLDGVRGIAVLLVILMHTGVLDNGYIGVDIFFAISGFLITSLLYEEWERTGAISFRRFHERRARRLLPALLVLLVGFTTVVSLTGLFSDGWPIVKQLATTLLFANNWVNGLGHMHALGPLSPTWSLAEEEQFYLLWPVALWLLLRLRVKPAAVIAVLLITIMALLQAVPHIRHAVPNYSTYFSPLDRFAELLCGCIAAVMWRYRYVPRAVESRVTSWLLLAGIAYLLFDHDMSRRWVYVGAAVLATQLIVNLLARESTVPARVIGCRPLRYVGTISYGVYLCHLLVHHLLVHYLPGRSPYFYAPIVIAISIGLAGASWHLLESRVLAGKRPYRMPALAGAR